MTWWSDLREHADVAEVWDSQATVLWGVIAVGLFTFWAGIGYSWLIIRFTLWLLISILNLFLPIFGYRIPLPSNTWRDSGIDFVLTVFSHISIDWTLFWIGVSLAVAYTLWEPWPEINFRLSSQRNPSGSPSRRQQSPSIVVGADEQQQVVDVAALSQGQRARLGLAASDQDQASTTQMADIRVRDTVLGRFKRLCWNWVVRICPPFLTNIIAFILRFLSRPRVAILFSLLVLYSINAKTVNIQDYIIDGKSSFSKPMKAFLDINFSIAWLWALLSVVFFFGASIWGLKNTLLSAFLVFSLFVLKVLWLMWMQFNPDIPWTDLVEITTPGWKWYLVATLAGIALFFVINKGIASCVVKWQDWYHLYRVNDLINRRGTDEYARKAYGEFLAQQGGATSTSARPAEHTPITPPSSVPRSGLPARVPADRRCTTVPAAEEPVPTPLWFLSMLPRKEILIFLGWVLAALWLFGILVYSLYAPQHKSFDDSSSELSGITRPDILAKIVLPVKSSTRLDTAILDPWKGTSATRSYEYISSGSSIRTPEASRESPIVDKKGRVAKPSNEPSAESLVKSANPPRKLPKATQTTKPANFQAKPSHVSSGSSHTISDSPLPREPSGHSHVIFSTTRGGWFDRKKDDYSLEPHLVTLDTTKAGWFDAELFGGGPETQPETHRETTHISSSKTSSRTTPAKTSSKTSTKTISTASSKTSLKRTSKTTRPTAASKIHHASNRTRFAPDTWPYSSTEPGYECQSLWECYCQWIKRAPSFTVSLVYSPFRYVIFPILGFILNLGGILNWTSDPWDMISSFHNHATFGEFVNSLPGDIWNCVSDGFCFKSGLMTYLYVSCITIAAIVAQYVFKFANKVPPVAVLVRISIWLPLPWLAFFLFGWFDTPAKLLDRPGSCFSSGWNVVFLLLFGLKGIKTGISLVSYIFFSRQMPSPRRPSLDPRDVTVLIPINNANAIEPDFRKVIISILGNNPWEIIIIAENLPTWSAVKRTLQGVGGQWTVYIFQRVHPTRSGILRAKAAVIKKSTRRQLLEYGIRESGTYITCVTNWDTMWSANFLRNTLAAFEDPVVHALGTAQIHNRSVSFQGFLQSVNAERQNFENTAAHNIDGGVSLLPNSTWFARTELLHNLHYRQGLLNESWLAEKLETNPGENYWTNRFFTNGGYNVAWYSAREPGDRPAVMAYDEDTNIHTLIRDQRTYWRYIFHTLFHDAIVWRRYPWSTFTLFWTKLFDNQLFLYSALFISRYLSDISNLNACVLWALIGLNNFFGRGFVVVCRAFFDYMNPPPPGSPAWTLSDLCWDVWFWILSATVWPVVEGAIVYWSLITCWVMELEQ